MKIVHTRRVHTKRWTRADPNQDRASAIDLVALELLNDSDHPVGNHRLVNALSAAGLRLGEATAGRVLRDLVVRGLARTLGKRGRVLTPAGQTMLDDLKRSLSRRQRSARLVAVATMGSAESLREMLLVRRAIEPEAARLAASRASEEDIRLLDSFARAHCAAPAEDGSRVEPAVCFHSQLVRSSHHKFLIEIGLMAIEQNDTPLLDHIAHRPGMGQLDQRDTAKDAAALAKDHTAIVDAIRRHDPIAAERRMRAHIDRLLAGTLMYIDRMGGA